MMRMNRLSGHLVTMQLAKTNHIEPYEGVAACRMEVDIRRLHQALRLPLRILRQSLVPDALRSFSSPYFRYCRKCLCRGYHGVMPQLASVQTARCTAHCCKSDATSVAHARLTGSMRIRWMRRIDAPVGGPCMPRISRPCRPNGR
jgi:hypothetical protein